MDAHSGGGTALRVVCLVAALLAVAAYGYAICGSAPTRFDDSYMFLRYADGILAGRGHAWNPDGRQVYGSTSLLHVGVVTGLRLCLPGLDDARLLLMASAIPGAVMMVMLVVGCAGCTMHRLLHRRYLLWAGLLLPVLVFDGTVRYHHQTGMDTMLAAACNALLILFTLRLVRQGGVGRVAPVVLFGYLTFLARPDNGVYTTLFPTLCILLLGGEQWRRLLVVFLSSMAAVLLLDGALKWLIFGNPLPLSFYAKQHGAYRGYANPDGPNPFFYLTTFLTVAIPYICVLLMFARRSTTGVLIALLAPVGVTFGYYFTVNQIMGGAGRFYFSSLPFFVVATAVVVDDRLRGGNAVGVFTPKELLWRLVITLLVLVAGREALGRATARYQARLPQAVDRSGKGIYRTAAAEPLPEVDRWEAIRAMARLAEDAPPGTVIALSEHGLVGASAPQVTLIDLVGLHDRQFALHGFSAEELFRREPDLIWMPHYHYTHILGGILHSERFWRQYTFYPRAFDYGLAIRNDSPRFDRLSELIDRSWKGLYGDRDRSQHTAVPDAGR